MRLVVTHALRLTRGDLARLGDVHRRQFVAAIAPNKPKLAEGLVEQKGDDEGDGHGLVYLRFHDEAAAKREIEGWLLDDDRYPSKRASPDGGAFFVADTMKTAGVQMSQGSVSASARGASALRDAITELVRNLPVKTSGALMKANPPFAYAKAPPPPPPPKQDAGTLPLVVRSARRFTESQIREAEPYDRFQFLHSVRPTFATPTMDGMEGTFALGMLWSGVDSGPDTTPETHGMRSGLFHVRLGVANDTREFDGWFMDTRTESADAYWPSTRATATLGRIFLANTVTFTGVALKAGRISVDVRAGLPIARALAQGLKKLGLTFDVEVGSAPASGTKGYFGSKCHKKHLKSERGYAEAQAKWKAARANRRR